MSAGRVSLWPLAVALAFASGCRSVPPAPRPGDAFVLRHVEPTPTAAGVTRETWTLADTAGGVLRWRVERDGVEAREEARSREDLAAGLPAVRRGRRLADGLVDVRVPAGTYRCRRLTRTFEEGNGRVMNVDEWWTPGVPVPVRRWVRWSGLPERLRHEPPAREADLVLGSAWAVLERAPRR